MELIISDDHEGLGAARRAPISFEVISDDFEEMKKQALFISSWG